MDTQRNRVLVVDDEESILNVVRIGLEFEGFEVVEATTGTAALRLFEETPPHVVILDVMLPDVDGFEVCDRMRSTRDTPILMLTARTGVNDVVRGLDSGADDYLSKPFKFSELLARVRALLRRVGHTEANVLVWENLVLDRDARQVVFEGRRIDLTSREFELLEMLMRRPRHVHTRDQILEYLWGGEQREEKVLKTCVSKLRAKLGDERRRLIRSVRGIGYTLGG